jgi:putative hydrolase of the HAD superfamily
MIYKGVLFDLFGTIIPRPDRRVHDEMMGEMGTLVGMEKDEFRSLWLSQHHQKTTWMDGDTTDLMIYMIEKAGMIPDRGIAEQMTKIWYEMTLSHFTYFPDVVPAFTDLKYKGINIGLLSNCGPNVPAIVENSKIMPFLDGAVYSTKAGIKKPDPEIYHMACVEITTEPGETIFIGDGDSNELDGAKRAGLTPIKIERGEIAGDYRLTEEPEWEPMISDLNDIILIIQSL